MSYYDKDQLALIEFLELMCDNKEFIILDDFNSPTLIWQINNVSHGAAPIDSILYN